jgi:hypothetical protein
LTAATKKSKSFKLLKTLKAVHTKKLLFGANATASSKFLSEWREREKGSVSFSAFHLSVFLSFSLCLSVSFFLSFSLFSSSSGSK